MVPKCPCKLWPALWTLQYRMGKLGLPRAVYIREREGKGRRVGRSIYKTGYHSSRPATAALGQDIPEPGEKKDSSVKTGERQGR